MFLQNVCYSSILIVLDAEMYIHIYDTHIYLYLSEDVFRKRNMALTSSDLGNTSSVCIKMQMLIAVLIL